MHTRLFASAWLYLTVLALLTMVPRSVRAADTPTAGDQAITEAVLAVNAQMIAAANRLDVDGFFEHIANADGGLIIQDGVIFGTRREAYDAVKRGLQGVKKLERRIDHPRVTVIGLDVALLVGDGSLDATFSDDAVMHSQFAVSLVFVRTGQEWKLLHGHYSVPNPR